MGSWLRKCLVSQKRPVSRAADRAVAVMERRHDGPVSGIEALEGRTLLSASTLDLTNLYGGSITFKAGKLKVKEAITINIAEQDSTGFVTGQVISSHAGTLTVKGKLDGKSLKLIGVSSGGLLQAKANKTGKALTGTLELGIDDSVGKFKVKKLADGATELIAPSSPRAVALNTALNTGPTTGTGGLDPTIDPATGLPIDPATGLPIDPGAVPGGTGDPGDGVTPPPVGAPGGGTGTGTPPAAGGLALGAPGTLIGTNYDFTGIWLGFFNADGTGSIDDPNNPGATATINGTRPGIDVRDVTFVVTAQDTTGLVSGTLDILEFGTFTFTGYINGTEVDLVLSGTSLGATTGVVQMDFDPLSGFSIVNGVIDAFANGYQASGPITATFDSAIPVPPVPLPAGQELYHVDSTDINGLPTAGNFDPNGASIGMDFAVGTTPLEINALGAFDADADGLTNPVRVAIYNAQTGVQIVAADITTANSSLATNSSFRYLTTFTPIELTAGIYRIVAFGYDTIDLAGDIGVDNYVGPVPIANTGPAGQIQYPVSNSLNANNYLSNPAGGGGGGGAISFPRNEQGLPLNRYLAGSALFEFGTPPDPNGGGGTPPPPPPPPLTKPANTAYPGGVYTAPTGPEVFGSQSEGIIP